MSGPKSGVASAMNALDAPAKGQELAHTRAAAAREAAGEQLALLPAGEEAARLDGLGPVPAAAGARRGPGRPKGSQNRNTQAVAHYLVTRYGCPVEGTLALGMKPLAELVAELREVSRATGLDIGGDLLDVLKLQMQALAGAMPYTRSRMPQAVEVKDTRLPVLILDGGAGLDGVPAEGEAWSIDRLEALDAVPLEPGLTDRSAEASPATAEQGFRAGDPADRRGS